MRLKYINHSFKLFLRFWLAQSPLQILQQLSTGVDQIWKMWAILSTEGEGRALRPLLRHLFYRLIYYADHVITLTLHNAKLFSIVGTSFSENSKREDSLASHEEGNASYAIQF